jgi:predicted O-methyltransferase YrrM
MGRVHGVKVPAALPKQDKPAPTGATNINILCEMLERTAHLSGAVADCGVYRGGSTVAMALYLRQSGRERPIYAFDSFEGFPADAIERDLQLGGEEDADRKQGGFSGTSFEVLSQKIRRFRLEKVTLVRGFFSDSLPAFPKDIKFSFVHLDVNLEASYRECLQEFYPRLLPGAIVLFDEYNDPPWPGCKKAVDEFLSDKPEKLEPIQMNNYIKYYIVKK